MVSTDKLKTFIVVGCNIAALALIIVGLAVCGEAPSKDDEKDICEYKDKYTSQSNVLTRRCDFFRTWQASVSFDVISLACIVCALVFLILCAIIKGKEYSTCCLFSRIPDAVAAVLLFLVILMLPITFNKAEFIKVVSIIPLKIEDQKFFSDAKSFRPRYDKEESPRNLTALWGCDFASMILLIASFVLPFFM